MKLLTENLKKTIPPLYTAEHEQDPMVWVKFFTPWTAWTYYVLEFDGTDTLFGWVEGVDFPELGYSSLSEIESLTGPHGLKAERDLYFKPRRLSEVKTAKERIHQHAEDDWICLCGNDALSDGFYPCNALGEEIDPTPKDWTTNCYVCAKCGRIINQDTHEVVGLRRAHPVEACMYSSDGAPATKHCSTCGGPLYSFCGARDAADNVYCNECFAPVEKRAGTAPPQK
jgi:Protein of unknown function (DUF2958)